MSSINVSVNEDTFAACQMVYLANKQNAILEKVATKYYNELFPYKQYNEYLEIGQVVFYHFYCNFEMIDYNRMKVNFIYGKDNLDLDGHFIINLDVA